MKDNLLLELEFDSGSNVHLFNRDHGIIAAISDPLSISRHDGWICVLHEAYGRQAETYIPADRFSHLTIIYPIEREERS